MISGPIILAGQLLGTAFACGLNLYATIALLGLAGRLGLVQLPPGMTGLQHAVVVGFAAALFFLEVVIDRVRFAGNAWEAVHTLIRPAAAGLLAGLALQDMPLYVLVAGAVAAALMAFAAHATKTGIRLIVSTRGGWAGRHRLLLHTAVSLLEDLTAVAIVVATLLYPGTALAVVGASLLLLLLAGPRLWRAALFGSFAITARVRGFFGRPGWRSREQLPRAVRLAIPPEPLGRSPARAVSAAVTGLPRVGAYRNGWLVFTCHGPRFVYRSFLGARSTPLPGATAVNLRTGILTDALDIRADDNGRSFTLFLLKDGPPARIAAAELTSVQL
jgi:hypothetical protein